MIGDNIAEMAKKIKLEKKPLTPRARRIRIIRYSIIGILCLLVIYYFVFSSSDVFFGPSTNLNSGSISGEWAMFRHDLNHTGNTDLNGIVPQGSLKWTFVTNGPIYSSPSVVDGTVYFGSRDGNFYALDAATGEKRWVYNTGNWIDSSPAVANGVVYFGSNDGNLYALKADTGEKIWSYNAKYPIRSSPAVAGRMVYFGSYDYSIYALDINKGTKRWSYETDGYIYASPVVSNGIVYACSLDNFCYALHAKSGRLRLRFKAFVNTSMTASPVVIDKTVYFNCSDGYLYAIDGNARNWAGEIKFRPFWTQLYLMGLATRPGPPSGFLWRIKVDKTTTSSPLVKDGYLYIGAGNNLVSIDTVKQEKRWVYTAGGTIESSPAISGNAILAAGGDGKLYAVDAASGNKLWDLPLGGKMTSSPAISRGVLYIGSHDGTLYAVE